MARAVDTAHAKGAALWIEANARAKDQELALGFARNMAVILSHMGSLAWDGVRLNV